MTRSSTTSQIAKLQKQLELLKKREAALSKSKQSKALAKIVQLAKESGLTAEDIVGALKTGKAAKAAKGAPKKAARKNPTAGKTVAPNTVILPTRHKPGPAVASPPPGLLK